MGILRQFTNYLYITKPDKSEPVPQWTKYMHGINRISILLFLMAMVFIIVRAILRH